MAAAFFSPQWCAQALAAEHAASADIIGRFKEPASFTHVLALEVADRPDVVCHLSYVEGRCLAWTTDLFAEDEVWARFTTTLEHWQDAAAGATTASKLVMSGKMKLTKGALKNAVENAPALDRILQCFSTIDTDWQI